MVPYITINNVKSKISSGSELAVGHPLPMLGLQKQKKYSFQQNN